MFKVCGCIWVVVGYSLSRLQLLWYYQEQLGRAMESAVVPTGQKWFCWSVSHSCSTTWVPIICVMEEAPERCVSLSAVFHYQLERNCAGQGDVDIVLISQEAPLGVACLQRGISVVSCYFTPYNGT